MPNSDVVVIGAIADAAMEVLEKSHHVASMSADELRSDEASTLLAEAHGLLVTGQAQIGEDVLVRAPNLRVISMRAVGVDSVDVSACTTRGVAVCNTPGILDAAVAELSILLMLAASRRFRENLERGGEGKAPVLGNDLRGKTMGVIGMGRIGLRVAETAARAFEMPVVYTNRHPREDLDTRVAARFVPLEELLGSSDVVSIHCPLSDGTRGLIGRRELSLMRPTSILITLAERDCRRDRPCGGARRGRHPSRSDRCASQGAAFREPSAAPSTQRVVDAAFGQRHTRDAGGDGDHGSREPFRGARGNRAALVRQLRGAGSADLTCGLGSLPVELALDVEQAGDYLRVELWRQAHRGD